jgi:hypothetical protein
VSFGFADGIRCSTSGEAVRDPGCRQLTPPNLHDTAILSDLNGLNTGARKALQNMLGWDMQGEAAARDLVQVCSVRQQLKHQPLREHAQNCQNTFWNVESKQYHNDDVNALVSTES